MWISLIGFMASGKSSVARVLAERALLPAVDLDAEIERRAAASIPEIFGREGVDGFRRREREALAALDPVHPLLLATGGGIVESAEETAVLRARGVVIWLDAPWEVLRRRLGAKEEAQRPLLLHLGWSGLERLHLRRRRLYAQSAHFRLRTDLAGPAVVGRMALTRALAWQRRHGGAGV